MPPVTRIIPMDSSSFGIAYQARMQDEERAVREDEAHFKMTGVNRLTAVSPPDIAEEENGDVVVIGGVRINQHSLGYQKWKEREDRIKAKEFKKIVEQADEEYYSNAISALKL